MSRSKTATHRPGGARTWYDRWSAACFIVLMHAAPVVAIVLGTRTVDWVVFFGLYPLFAFSTGVVLHRFFAHRSFETSRWVQFALAWLACTMFVDPVSFAGKHRLHHRFSDTVRDVHSPGAGFWFCWFGSLIDEGYSDAEFMGAAPDLMWYPELRWLHRNYFVPGGLVGAMLLATGGFSMFAIGYCLNIVVVLNQSSALNYVCHRWGYRRYPTHDLSRNNILIALLTFGEGWHNNHHRFPRSARTGTTWWEIDPFYWVIRALQTCGVVSNVRVALAARGESRAAFARRSIPAGGVAPRSNMPNIFPRRALPAGRLAGLGAQRDLHHRLPGVQSRADQNATIELSPTGSSSSLNRASARARAQARPG